MVVLVGEDNQNCRGKLRVEHPSSERNYFEGIVVAAVVRRRIVVLIQIESLFLSELGIRGDIENDFLLEGIFFIQKTDEPANLFGVLGDSTSNMKHQREPLLEVECCVL